MGTVWRAYDELLGRAIAVKQVFLPDVTGIDPVEQRARTMREARAAARLTHPNAVTVHDVIEEDGQPWIVMQLVVSDSLADVIEATGPLPPRRVAEVGLAVLGALEAAHIEGILHRDVKPANVLLGHDGRIVLTDFGVATLEGDPALTGTGFLVGSPPYMAPERPLGRPLGPGSDLWSLGATMYAAVEGRPPYDQETPMAILIALATQDPPAPRIAGPLTAVIEGLLQRDPDRRLDARATRLLLQEALSRAAEPPTVVEAVGARESPFLTEPPTVVGAVPGRGSPPRMQTSDRTTVIGRKAALIGLDAEPVWICLPSDSGYTLREYVEEERYEPVFLGSEGVAYLFRSTEGLLDFLRSGERHDLLASPSWREVKPAAEVDVTPDESDSYELDLVVMMLQAGADSWDDQLLVRAGQGAYDLATYADLPEVLEALAPGSPLDALDDDLRNGGMLARRRLRKLDGNTLANGWRNVISRLDAAVDFHD